MYPNGIKNPIMSIRMRLRYDTRKVHERLDHSFSTFDLTSNHDYERFLRTHINGLAAIESLLERQAPTPAVAALPRLNYLPLALADHAALPGNGPHPPAPDLLALPEPALTPITSPETATGLIYVIAGSRLGARILATRVNAASTVMPATYLNEESGSAYWQQFVSALEVDFKTGSGYYHLRQGALSGFDLFQQAFNRALSIDDSSR